MQGEEGDGLDDSLFFKSEDSNSLSQLLTLYIDGNIHEQQIRRRILHLKKLYSWQNAAKATMAVYETLKQPIL